MSYCINPWCDERLNPDQLEFCQSCGTSLSINERYRIIRPLRKLDSCHDTEIFEINNLGTSKVLKVLNSNRRRLVQLFEQEAKILKQLHHLEVPSVDTYFTFTLEDQEKELHCLVIELIPGQNLVQWLEQNGVLSEELALDWLCQLIQFLQDIHQAEILHRDIKPSNIMIRPDGKLILIDFGTARHLSKTYIDKLEQGDLTRVYTAGYTAPEQIQGQAVCHSDFFALGRTFVHLLTGIHPDQLLKDPQTQELIWRDQAPQISNSLANLIDELISSSLQERRKQPLLMVEKIKLELELNAFELTSGGQLPRFFPSKLVNSSSLINTNFRLISQLIKMLVISIAIALTIGGIRYLGWLQPFELQAFDHLMTLRPIEQPDSRFLIVTIDEQDIQYQNQQVMAMRGSLSDAALLELLKKLKQYQAKTIGLDLYRDFPVNSEYPQLKTYLSSSDNLFAPCKVPAPQDGDPHGVASPPEIPESRLGFSDVVADNYEVIRRHLLNLTPTIISSCNPEFALSLQIAQHYLSQQGIKFDVTAKGELKMGKVVLQPLNNHSAGYHSFDASGYQILLNYRSLASPRDIAQQISLTDILGVQSTSTGLSLTTPGDNNIASQRPATELTALIKDRIVLIGVIAPSSADWWHTPISQSISTEHKQPGIIVQTHAISQIISAVLDGRSLIWWWSAPVELLWIWSWAGLGAILAWLIRHPVYLGLAITAALFLLFSICFGMLIKGGWIPIIPPALALMTTTVVMVRFTR